MGGGRLEATFLIYGGALDAFLGIGRLRPAARLLRASLLVAVEMVTALAIVILPIIDGQGGNSKGLLVIVAAELPYFAAPPASSSSTMRRDAAAG